MQGSGSGAPSALLLMGKVCGIEPQEKRGIEMRRWKKGIVAGVAAVSLLVGNTTVFPQVMQAASAGAYVRLEDSLADGIYEGTAMVEDEEDAFEAYPLQVTVTVADHMITGVTYSGAEGEHATYMQSAYTGVFDQISNTDDSKLEVDAVSGATRSCEGMVRAVNQALKKGSLAGPKLKSVKQTAKGMEISFGKVADAEQYILYRNGKKYETLTKNHYVDKKAKKNGAKYKYYVTAVVDQRESDPSEVKSGYVLSKNQINILLNGSAGKMTFTWNVNKKASGYQFQYATNPRFSGAKTKTVKDKQGIIATVSNVRVGTTYYIRVRDYKKIGKQTCKGPWSSCKKIRIYR